MGWKGTIEISRDEAIERLNRVYWDELSNEELQDILENTVFKDDHVCIVENKKSHYETY